jgi:hypothetical protein
MRNLFIAALVIALAGFLVIPKDRKMAVPLPARRPRKRNPGAWPGFV